MPDSEPKVIAGARGHRDRRPALSWLAVIVTVTSLFGALGAGGIWDPYELEVAELSRRIAVSLFGATELTLDDVLNDVPTLGELGRGELPFTSVALGFKLFGLGAWAGRLPLAIWGLVGACALFVLLARLVDRAAAAFATLALSTMPLYFVQARTILGDIVLMASMAIAVTGLGLATFDGSAARFSAKQWTGWLLVGIAGLWGGFMTRGALLGVAVPALAVGAGWGLSRLFGAVPGNRLHDVAGGGAVLVGCVASGAGLWALRGALAPDASYSMLLGTAVNSEAVRATHDIVIRQLGHALFPWSALLPISLAAMLKPPSGDCGAGSEYGLRAVLVLTLGLGYVVHAMLAPYLGSLPFGPVFAPAAMVGLFLRDMERGARASIVQAMVSVAVLALLYLDFDRFPDAMMSAYCVDDAALPASFLATASVLLLATTSLLAVVAFFSLMEDESQPRFRAASYLSLLSRVRNAGRGWVLFGLSVVEVALAIMAVLALLSSRYFQWTWFETLPVATQLSFRFAWLVLPGGVLVGPLAVVLVRDTFRMLYASRGASEVGTPARDPRRCSGLWLRAAKWRPTRATGVALAFCSAGAVLSLVFFPGVLSQLSPQTVVERYRKLSRPGEPLGMLGLSQTAASYMMGRQVETFPSEVAAFRWLSNEQRRWLVIRASDLPQLNFRYRDWVSPRANLPVLDGRSSSILLVSNQRRPGEPEQSPFRRWILDRRPSPTHVVKAQLEDKLRALGWDVTTSDGRPVDSIRAGRSYWLVLYWEVLSPILPAWKTFVHIDGFQRRFNADHDTLQGKYPLHTLLPGDFFADRHQFTVDLTFAPGRYHLYYGMFRDSRRLKVASGKHHDDRIEGGVIVIR